MWKMTAEVIPFVVVALGAKHQATDWMVLLRVDVKKYTLLQQTALLRSAKILRKS